MLGRKFSDSEGITVPYPAMGGDHHGFFDFRGKPDAAESVPEAAPSPALRRLLRRLAEEGAPLFSVGCELGGSEKDDEWTRGGYVQLLARDYAEKSEAELRRFVDGVLWDLEEASGQDHWAVEVSPAPVRVRLDGGDVDAPSIILNFHAHAASEDEALAARERLLDALQACLFGRALQFLGYAI